MAALWRAYRALICPCAWRWVPLPPPPRLRLPGLPHSRRGPRRALSLRAPLRAPNPRVPFRAVSRPVRRTLRVPLRADSPPRDRLQSGAAMTVQGMLVSPLLEIVGSVVLGAALGLLLSLLARFFRSRGNKLALTIAFVFLALALCDLWGLSNLLCIMMIGAVMTNLCPAASVIIEQTDRFTPPLFLLFFVISGAELDLSVLPTVGLVGACYVVVRVLGKWLGSFLGSRLVNAHPNVQKYLGFTLIPQAGVAIGMAQLALTRLPAYGSRIQAVVLAGTLIYELVVWGIVVVGPLAPFQQNAFESCNGELFCDNPSACARADYNRIDFIVFNLHLNARLISVLTEYMRHFQPAHFIRHIVFISAVARRPVKPLHGSHAHLFKKFALVNFLPILFVERSRFHFF